MGSLCAHLLLQFNANCFETLQGFWSWSDVVHVVSIKSSDYLLSHFLQVELIFQALLLSKCIDSR